MRGGALLEQGLAFARKFDEATCFVHSLAHFQ
jgi:hypothetical protein